MALASGLDAETETLRTSHAAGGCAGARGWLDVGLARTYRSDSMSRRLAATVALLVGAATGVPGVAVSVSLFPRGLGLLSCVVIAGAAAWYGVLRRGIARVAGLTVAGLALVGALGLVLAGGGLL